MDLQDSVQRSLQNTAEKSCRSAQIRKDRKPENPERPIDSHMVFLHKPTADQFVGQDEYANLPSKNAKIKTRIFC